MYIFTAKTGSKKYLCGGHQVVPVTFAYRRILQFPHSLQGGQGVLNGQVKTRVGVPGAHVFVQHLYLFGELLALDIHVFHVNLPPGRGFPVVDARVDDMYEIPQFLNNIT